MKPSIGIIGGSGLYSMAGFEAHHERDVETPWGAPSDPYIIGRLGGKVVAFSRAMEKAIEFPRPS